VRESVWIALLPGLNGYFSQVSATKRFGFFDILGMSLLQLVSTGASVFDGAAILSS
jgi:hypothetical protein